MKKLLSFLIAVLCLSTQVYAEKIQVSTTMPDKGVPEHVYTMRNCSDTPYYATATTSPTLNDAAKGAFAFYAVEGVSGAYYIYSCNEKKWLEYQKAASYNEKKGFVTLSSNRTSDVYFKVDNYSDDNYQISPYKTDGTAAAIYLNWFQGANVNEGQTVGLWTDGGADDGGSRWVFAATELTVFKYRVSVPQGVTLKIGGEEYADGSEVSSFAPIALGDVTAIAEDGKFAIVSIDEVNKTITVNVATLPALPEVATYENAWVYPKQQDNVGVASLIEDGNSYILKNNVLAAAWMKVGNALYFAGANAMNLVAGTEPFTVAFGSGDNVPASAMTLKSVETETLAANSTAIGGAEHFAGVQLVANYGYTYNGAEIAIVWRAVLRDGSHYIRTEMDLTGVDAVDMYNIIPMIYNVDTNAAGSTPKVVGNTRGATIVSNKIFAGLETPMAYNTVGEATGEEDLWELKETLPVVALTSSSWTQVASGKVPNRLTELTAKSYPNVLAYNIENVTLKKGQKAEIKVEYKSGNNRLNLCGADLLDAQGSVVTGDYKVGFTGTAFENNVFNLTASNEGTYTIRVFVENLTEPISASSNVTVKIYDAKEGVVIKKDVVGIQGRWSRNTTLAKGETWKVGAVVGLIAQDGKQNDANIRNTQKRRSFLAYSERERAVPWRAFPHYNSWYELNIDRNNAAPGQEHTNFTAEDILRVMRVWKEKYYDRFGAGLVAFVIDDGWDNYGPWTFHSGFPNQMKDMSSLAKEMGAGIGAWLGPVGGYGQSGTYRRQYWSGKGGMQLSNPAYYEAFLTAADNLVCRQDGVPGYQPGSDNYVFFKFDGISAQPVAYGPDNGDTGNENAEGIIRLEQYVRENMREDIFFNTTVGTWASPFWYQVSDATWRQEGDHGRIGNNSINRENWITYRDRLVYDLYVSKSPICPINTLMTHGFILTKNGPPGGDSKDYATVLRELRCSFICGSGMVELYADYEFMNSINNGKLWEDLAECIAWQKKNADVLPDAHWVGGNPWTGSTQEVYGWASWNGSTATLALRNGGNSDQTYKFTLREALEIPANITGKIILNKSFKVQDSLSGLTEGEAIDIDTELTVTLPGSSVFAFDGRNADISEVPFKVVNKTPSAGVETLKEVNLTFNFEFNLAANAESQITFKKGDDVCAISSVSADGVTLKVVLAETLKTPAEYTLNIPKGVVTRKLDNAEYSGAETFVILNPSPIKVTAVSPENAVKSLSEIQITFSKEVVKVENAKAVVLEDAEGETVATPTYTVDGTLMTVTFEPAIAAEDEYTLVIPDGVIVGAALGDSYSGEIPVVVNIYLPRNNGTVEKSDRKVSEVALLNNIGENIDKYELTATEQTQDYTVATNTVFRVNPSQVVTPVVTSAGSWVHFYVFVDFDKDGFTAGIKEGSNWEPTGDLVSYSFYNNNASSDESGWNSTGDVISGNDRNKPELPAFVAPAEPGTYRMRFKQDWCSIDPDGDADGKFDDFKKNRGQIIDVLLEVVGESTAISEVETLVAEPQIYDLSGRKLDTVPAKGIYIINNKKVVK